MNSSWFIEVEIREHIDSWISSRTTNRSQKKWFTKNCSWTARICSLRTLAGAVASISPPSNITLKTTAINDLLQTFDDNKVALRAIFDERRKILDRFNCGYGYDYSTVLYRIATPTQQQQMYCCICEAFAEKNYNLIYENLFWKILLPEWLIAICAKQFSCSKEQIIAQIKEDDEHSFNEQNLLDLQLNCLKINILIKLIISWLFRLKCISVIVMF